MQAPAFEPQLQCLTSQPGQNAATTLHPLYVKQHKWHMPNHQSGWRYGLENTAEKEAASSELATWLGALQKGMRKVQHLLMCDIKKS